MSEHTIEIDGSQGEGGGQVLRSCLALSLATGRPMRISNIRGRRKNPGLRRQHLTAVQAATAIGQADAVGATIGSDQLTFSPTMVAGGDYQFRIGSAGSTTLVLQTILLPLLLIDQSSKLTMEGGTHNPMAPPYDFLEKCYLPLVRRLGRPVRSQLHRHGFYPAGGGRFEISISGTEASTDGGTDGGTEAPVTLRGFDLVDRGDLQSRVVRCLVANLPRHIAEREWSTIRRKSGWPEKCGRVEEVEATGPGNVVLVELHYQHVVEIVCGFGKVGVPAEKVATRTLRDARHYEQSGAVLGQYLADQWLLPLAFSAWSGGGGGRFLCGPLSGHSTTHIDVIRRFLDVRIDIQQLAPQLVEVSIHGTTDTHG